MNRQRLSNVLNRLQKIKSSHRSQTLYPAELRSHIIAVFNSKAIITKMKGIVNTFYRNLLYQHRRKILRVSGNQFIMASVPFPFKDGSRPFRAVNVTEHAGLHLVFVNQLFENRVLFCRVKRRIMQSQQDFIVPFFFGSVQRSSDPQRFMTEDTVVGFRLVAFTGGRQPGP